MTQQPTSIPSPCRSFLKWAGGKTRSAPTIAQLGPADGYERYVEPFCGSAAVFFALRPERALLADAIEDLVLCFEAVRDDPEAVMARLDEMPNRRSYFNRVRKQDPAELGGVERAARAIYLNKTAFRGLWRVNRKGEFNTPYGEYDRPYYNPATLLAASEALQGAELRHADFREVLGECEAGDWIYLDPPYVPDRQWGDFTRYTPGQFGPQDQEELAQLVGELDERGVRWLLTNSDTAVVRDLYAGWHMGILPTRRDITLRAPDRASVDMVISNYEPKPHDNMLQLDDWDAA